MRISLTILAVAALNLLYAQCDPTYGKLVINEVMPFQTNVVANVLGEFEDWVEIHNASEEAIDLGGYYLSDGRTNRTKFQFPDTVIPAGGHIIVWCDGNVDLPGLHAEFSLTSDGEQVVFSDPDTVLVDYMRFTEAFENVSIGRFPSGFGPWMEMIPSYSSVNTNGQNLNLVINEFLARNSNVLPDPNGEFDDWIEIHNVSNAPINLNGYFLSDGIGNAIEFEFPAVVIPAMGYVIVWADGQPEQGNLHAPFSLSGELGDDIMLSDPDTNTVDFITFGPQEQNVSEGRFPNGLGAFSCLDPTPGAANSLQDPLSVSDGFGTDEHLAFWPNPVIDRCTIEYFKNETSAAEIIDARGVQIMEFTLKPGLQTIDLGNLAPGMYLIREPHGTKRLLKID
jgi:hypothetical protein